jgi:hypothetical protein
MHDITLFHKLPIKWGVFNYKTISSSIAGLNFDFAIHLQHILTMEYHKRRRDWCLNTAQDLKLEFCNVSEDSSHSIFTQKREPSLVCPVKRVSLCYYDRFMVFLERVTIAELNKTMRIILFPSLALSHIATGADKLSEMLRLFYIKRQKTSKISVVPI